MKNNQLISSTNRKTDQKINAKDVDEIPCRGCTSNCEYKRLCDGKLWRFNQSNLANGEYGELV